ncbi:MAG: CrcB family protein [Planctomycetes bacterium]|nr:CrcB family protein [Planctomycetota bacterium]
MFAKLALLAAAGALGTLARFGVSSWVQRGPNTAFPLGTLAVNLLGCFAFGLVWALAERRFESIENLRLYALTGFMGAFTTFSTYAFDGSVMLARQAWWTFAAYVGLQNVLGIVLVIAGLALGRKF